MKVGIVGCGTIGTEIALAISKEMISGYSISGIYDIDETRVGNLLSIIEKPVDCMTLDRLIEVSDLIFEATQKSFMPVVVEKVLAAGKKILAMSVGGMADRPDLHDLAE